VYREYEPDSNRASDAAPYTVNRASRNSALGALVTLLALIAANAAATPVYQPPGANLTFGDVTHGLRVLSAAGNPAAAAADAARGEEEEGERRGGLVFSGVLGIEFGNIDGYYDLIDSIGDDNRPSIPPDPPDPEEPPEGPVDRPKPGIDLGDIIEICCPDLNDLIDRVENELKNRLILLGLIRLDAYAKVFESVDVPILFGKEAAGGAWTLGINWSLTSKSYSLIDSTMEFDRAAALADLSNQYNLMPGDPITTFDIAGDVDVVIDPVTGSARAILDNDSVLVTKAAQTNEIAVGYGRQFLESGSGGLFVGGKLNFYDLKLSRAVVRYGDITDTEAIFDSIRDTEYVGEKGLGIDVGLLWVSDRFQMGATWTNLNEPTFRYAETDLSSYKDESVIYNLAKDRTYTMQHQLKLEASLFTESRRWAVNFGLDANDTQDPMGDAFRWFTVSGGWTTNNQWLHNARFGYRHNLVGTELEYFSAGVTAFKWFNLDLAMEIDRVEIEDRTLPRGLIASAGFQVNF
jgi:hypothetical protein